MGRDIRYLGWEVGSEALRPSFMRSTDHLIIFRVEVDGLEYRIPHIIEAEIFEQMRGNIFHMFRRIALSLVEEGIA